MAFMTEDRATPGWFRALFLGLAAGGVVLAVTSCSPTPGGMASMANPTTGPAPTMVSPQPSTPAAQTPEELAFTAPRLGGGVIRGADYAGQDLVVWFWAPW